MNGMEFEPIDHSILLQTGDLTFLDTNIQDEILDQGCMERLLQIQTELMDISKMSHSTTELCGEVSLEVQGNVDALGGGITCLKEIQAEVMEERNLADLLKAASEAAEAQNWALALNIIERLYILLSCWRAENSNLSDRLAVFFTQGLHSKCMDALQVQSGPVSGQDKNMAAFQMLQQLSPCLKFAHFTANQAILEATEGDLEIHVMDFDIMEGIQWPPLMADLSSRKGASLKVTSVTSDQQSMSTVQQTGRRLKEFAASINLPFVFDQITISREEDFEKIQVGKGIIVNCMIHQFMPGKSFSLVKTFLSGIRKLSPKLLVLVEEELFSFARIKSISFSDFIFEALQHYSSFSDSLSNGFFGGYKIKPSLVENDLLGVRILDSLRQFPLEKEKRIAWGKGFSSMKRYKAIPFSSYNISQAKFLVTLYGSGYWVKCEKCRLALCWKSRPLIAASIWVPRHV